MRSDTVVNLCCTWYSPISEQIIIVVWLRAGGTARGQSSLAERLRDMRDESKLFA